MGVDYSMYEFIWHESGYAYSKELKGLIIDDITFHYRYEAKCYKHLLDYHSELFKDTTLFWIIGSVPDLESTSKLTGLDIPTEIKEYIFKKPDEGIDDSFFTN